jgi:hypothetical protein
MKRANPIWTSSAKPETEDQLYLYNSFTRQKVKKFTKNNTEDISNDTFYFVNFLTNMIFNKTI